MPLHVSERGRLMPASPIRKLAPLADAAKRRGVKVYHLNIGQPDLETPAPMRAKLALAPKVFAYTPSAGTAECVQALCEYYRRIGVALTADARDGLEAVAVFCREHGLFLVGDEVYREFVYDGRSATSILSLAGCDEIGIVVDSLPKRYRPRGLPL